VTHSNIKEWNKSIWSHIFTNFVTWKEREPKS